MQAKPKMLFSYTFFVVFIRLSWCLKLLDLRVPEVVDVRDEAVFTCLYDLGGDELYSVKWYKEELEFYRFMPDNIPQIQTFSVEGVKVLESKSNVTVITLSPLNYSASGMYKCEVSSERPHFKTTFKSGNMSVLALPRGEPRIEGIKDSYLLGDYIEGNCTSSPSYPLAQVHWLINGKQAKDWFVEPYKPVEIKDDLNLEYRSVGLRFQVDMNHFNEKGQVLNLTCQETLAGKMKTRSVVVKLSKVMTNQKFAQEQLNNGDKAPPVKIFVVLSISLLASL